MSTAVPACDAAVRAATRNNKTGIIKGFSKLGRTLLDFAFNVLVGTKCMQCNWELQGESSGHGFGLGKVHALPLYIAVDKVSTIDFFRGEGSARNSKYE